MRLTPYESRLLKQKRRYIVSLFLGVGLLAIHILLLATGGLTTSEIDSHRYASVFVPFFLIVLGLRECVAKLRHIGTIERLDRVDSGQGAQN